MYCYKCEMFTLNIKLMKGKLREIKEENVFK